MSEGRLNGRVAMVTGAGRGIGKAIALKMAREGASIVVLDVRGEDAERAAKELKAAGTKSLGLKVDISQQEEVEKAVRQAVENFGRVDILVNNAGVIKTAPLDKVRAEDWDAMVKVNLKGTFFCTQAVIPVMKKNQYGKIVSIGSRASLGKEDRTVYGATKAGLIGMTRTWALELAPFRINVNYVGPGPIATELFTAANPPDSEKTKALVKSIPLGRMGQPEDIANAVAFLASDEASFITGQSIFVCGGLTVGLVHF